MSKGPARLIDIDANGASLIATRPGKPCEAIWLGIPSLPCEWVKATVRGTYPEGSLWLLHLAFSEPCPAGLLEEATGLFVRSGPESSFRMLFNGDGDYWNHH